MGRYILYKAPLRNGVPKGSTRALLGASRLVI